MPKRTARLTPFARFLIVMIIVAPLAYMGAAWYNGEDGWQKLKELVGIEKSAPAPTNPQNTTEVPTSGSNQGDNPSNNLQERITSLEQQVEQLQQRIEALERRLEQQGK